MDAVEKQPIPWQKRKELGLIKAFWQTAKQVLFKPGNFFDNLEIKGSYSQPLFFAVSMFLTGIVITITYSTLLKKGITLQQYLFTLVLASILSFTLFPIMTFIVPGIMHLSVLLFRGKGGFKGTFNVFAYSSAACIFYVIPYVGMLIGVVWCIIVIIIGYKRIHKFSTIEAIFAYCLPAIFAFVLLLTAIAIPNLLRARIIANESAAQATLKTISAAVENYAAANNGQYPSEEYFRYTKPPYLDKIYNNKTMQGYTYSLNLNPNGYKITATPSKCGTTGTKIFTIETEGNSSEKSCK